MSAVFYLSDLPQLALEAGMCTTRVALDFVVRFSLERFGSYEGRKLCVLDLGRAE